MARLDVFPMPGTAVAGYVLDVQADLLSELATRVVVPLLPEMDVPKPIRDLNPVFEIDGATFVLVAQAIATVPARELKRCVASLAAERDRVTRALDTLFIGL